MTDTVRLDDHRPPPTVAIDALATLVALRARSGEKQCQITPLRALWNSTRSASKLRTTVPWNILKAIPPANSIIGRMYALPRLVKIAWRIVRRLYVRVDMVSQCFSHVIGDPHPAMAEILGRFEDTTRRHNRQLDSLYLRPMGARAPSTYGASGDSGLPYEQLAGQAASANAS